jgi:hypothetical protein
MTHRGKMSIEQYHLGSTVKYSTEESAVGVPLVAVPVEQDEEHSSCRDPIFAALFLINVAAVAYLAIVHGLDALTDEEIPWVPPPHDRNKLIGCLLGTTVFGGLACFAWLQAMIHNASEMLRFSFTLWATTYAAGAVIFLLLGNPLLSIVSFVGLVSVWCMWCATRLEPILFLFYLSAYLFKVPALSLGPILSHRSS